MALVSEENRRVQVDEIAKRLSVPKHFLAKIMKRVVKEGILDSTKGPYGGFSVNGKTLSLPLIRLLGTTDGMEQFNICVLQFRTCDHINPCPLHTEMDMVKQKLIMVLNEITIADLLRQDKKKFINSIATI